MFRYISVWRNIRRLNDRNSTKRRRAIDALGRLGDQRAVEPLVKLLCDEKEVRCAAAEALSKLGESKWHKWIKGDEEDEEFMRLARSGEAIAIDLLAKWLRDGDSGSTRSCAAKALGESGDRRTVEPLIEALEDPDGTVRRAAAEALGQFGDPRAVEPLIKMLADPNEVVREGRG